jgi:cysteine desulfurase / selenocysteine lyase
MRLAATTQSTSAVNLPHGGRGPIAPPPRGLDVERIRQDFPALAQRVHGHPLVYLDNAATTQKPRAVIDTLRHYYEFDNANIHRGVHELSARATENFERVRDVVRRFLNAADSREIIFTRGTTEAINLVAATYGRQHVGPGDEIIISAMEHHSNIVPWQMLCQEKGARLRVIPVNDDGELRMDAFNDLLGPHTRLVAIVHLSNVLGTINPVAEIIAAAHGHGVPVLVDGAQSAAHLRVDVRELDCDFYCCSAHKMFGPTGVGVLYGKTALLNDMPPYQGGGDMINEVSFELTSYKEAPYKFEAGTPNIAGVIGLGTAIEYVNNLDLERVAAYEHELLEYTTRALSAIPQVRLIGTARQKSSVISFVIEGIHPHDVGTILDQEGIAIRTGHHCAQPLMERFGLPATARASLAVYNTKAEADALAASVHKVIEVFK